MNLLLIGDMAEDERDEWAAALRERLPGHRLCLARGELPDDQIQAAIVANPAPGSLAGLTQLRLIQSLWAGVDRLLADPALPPRVPIARMVDAAMNEAMAETALWATLGLHRGFFRYARQQRAGHWRQLRQYRADETPVLVLGLGQMGCAVARRLLRQGYPVAAWRRGAGKRRDGEHLPPGLQVHSGSAALRSALAGAQVLINLLPLTPETRGLIDASVLAALPRGAGLVNLARGAHLVDDDLLAALNSGQIGQAVLDVFDAEPLAADHPYWQHPRVTVLPHVAAQTDVRSAVAAVAQNIEALASGAPLQHRVKRAAGY